MAAQPFTLHHFLDAFRFDGMMSVLTADEVSNEAAYYGPEEDIAIDLGRNVYFGPAQRKAKGDTKTAVLGSMTLWVDADDPQPPLATFPPSILVMSGHGYHLYWLLREAILDVKLLESLNKIVLEDVPTGDKGTWNCNRYLRVPGTVNTKYDPPVLVELRKLDLGIRYDPDDFRVLAKLDSKTKHKIRTGDRRGYKSRSERDWSIIMKLIATGASDALITTIFDHQPCGEKHRESPQYLSQTLERAHEKEPELSVAHNDDDDEGGAKDIATFSEDGEGYFVTARRGIKRLSTFTITPRILLDGSRFDSEDAIVCDVNAAGYTWKDKVFSRSAFTSVRKFDSEAPVAAWQWLGRDDDIRQLLPYLLDKLREEGLHHVGATSTLGLHKIDDTWMFLGDKEVMTAEKTFEGYEGPLCWLPSKKEHPELDLQTNITMDEVRQIGEMVPKLNKPETIYPMIGWYSATCLKPWIESMKYRYPILNVVGTKGSGKTTLIQRVFLKLNGQTDPKTYDAGTTKFVTLALLGSSNAVPIAFSEFRYEFVEKLLRTVLLAYDTGHDPRGRGDQTTVDYPLSAPFSIDGEDLVADPAARERLIVAHLHPETIAEGTEPYQVFNALREEMPAGFAGYFLHRVLSDLPILGVMLNDARKAIFEAFPRSLPDRVRNNHIVAYFGVMLWCKYTEHPLPDASVMEKSISSVFNLKAGRASTLADLMVEDLSNAFAQGNTYFKTAYDEEKNIFWFQLTPAHTWWVTSRRRSGRGALERDAIKAQLSEAPYSVAPQAISDAWMYGVDLKKAFDAGLDVPLKISERVFTVRF